MDSHKINPARTIFPDAILILSNRPYANEHVYILWRLWRHRMTDGITTARAVGSRGIHDIGFGFDTSDSRLTNIAGSADPYRWRNRHGRNGVASFAEPGP